MYRQSLSKDNGAASARLLHSERILKAIKAGVMKAAVLYGKEDVRVEQVTSRPLEPGGVRVRIEAALTCGTDLKVYKRGYHARMIVPPAVFGHELAGVIAEIANPKLTSEWQIGDRVVVANSAPCGHCFYCRHDQENLCDDLLFLNGAYAESIAIPARLVEKNMLRLKETTEFRDAALTEPLACVVKGIEDTAINAGEHVLVIGAGPIGLMFVALLKKLGCNVAVAGRGPRRLDTARRLGADHVFDVTGHARPALELPPENTFDVVIEAVGKPETWVSATTLVRKGGRVNFFGGCPSGTKAELDTGLLHYSSLTLFASFHHTPGTIRRALEYIEAGWVRAADFVDGESCLEDLPQLFHSMATGNHAVKTLIRVQERK
jgi:L-iditol 2-dehydrogenase